MPAIMLQDKQANKEAGRGNRQQQRPPVAVEDSEGKEHPQSDEGQSRDGDLDRAAERAGTPVGRKRRDPGTMVPFDFGLRGVAVQGFLLVPVHAGPGRAFICLESFTPTFVGTPKARKAERIARPIHPSLYSVPVHPWSQKQRQSLSSAQVFRSAFARPVVGHDVKGQLLAFRDGVHSGAFDGSGMNKNVRSAALDFNEAETLGGVEKFHCASAHDDFLSINQRECPAGPKGRDRTIKSMLMGKSPEREAQIKFVKQDRWKTYALLSCLIQGNILVSSKKN
ncbi:hypothetical protein ABID12_004097 [Martelella mangrovi]|uniref:Uncharacterized protein n=1 Tax=Martelella mangrovi TaxID=1397477 RepID=A0ABV2IGR5_9HYPH